MPSLRQFAVTADMWGGVGSLVSVRGQVDVATIRGVEQQAYRQLELHGPRLVLDLAQTTFMDSSGLQLIERLSRRTVEQGGALVVIASTYAVRRVLQIAPPSSEVRLVNTRQEARDYLNGKRGLTRPRRDEGRLERRQRSRPDPGRRRPRTTAHRHGTVEA